MRLLPSLALAILLAAQPSLPTRAEEAPAPGLIEVKVTGSGGHAILLIPGLAIPGSIWDDTVKTLQAHDTCYVVTLAGFGGQPAVPARPHFLADVRDAIIAYAGEHHLDHPILIGHSLGGFLALDIAEKAPDLPGRLIIVDSGPFIAGLMTSGIRTIEDAQKVAPMLALSLSAASREQFAQGQRLVIDRMVTSPERAAAIAAETGRSHPPTVGQAMGELFATDLRPGLGAIRCPVLVLGALADKILPDVTREQVEEKYNQQYVDLPQTQFQFFPDSRHFIMVDDPFGFERALLRQLAEAGADGSQDAKARDPIPQ